MSVKDVVAERFLQLCKERHIKINELANLSGVTPSTAYSMLDKTRRDISIITIKHFVMDWILPWENFFLLPSLIILNKSLFNKKD